MSTFSFEDRTFFWDRKETPQQRGVSVSEFLLFFKIKHFKDLKDICPSYGDFEHWNDKIRTIVSSFLNFPISFPVDDPLCCIPQDILKSYNGYKEEVLSEAIEWTQTLTTKDHWDNILDFFENDFCGRVLEKMDYPLKTPLGKRDVSLIFAENFRFKTEQGYFNIFNIAKDKRGIVIPQDDDSLVFVADFRQFEFRTFLKLQGMEKYLKEDSLYEVIGKDLSMPTEDVKVGVISSLYGGKRAQNLEDFFKRDELLNKIEDNIFLSQEGPVYIPSSHESGKKVHTIVQTVSQYVYLKKLDQILKMLQDKKSKFIFPLHDSIILSLRRDEPEVLDNVLSIMEDETYKVKCYIGSNFKDIVEI